MAAVGGGENNCPAAAGNRVVRVTTYRITGVSGAGSFDYHDEPFDLIVP